MPAQAGIPLIVIPAKAGIQGFQPPFWTPACAGVTMRGAGVTRERFVIPAEAGIQGFQPLYWTPAYAGVTMRGAGVTMRGAGVTMRGRRGDDEGPPG